jgi:hypothetical protein
MSPTRSIAVLHVNNGTNWHYHHSALDDYYPINIGIGIPVQMINHC